MRITHLAFVCLFAFGCGSNNNGMTDDGGGTTDDGGGGGGDGGGGNGDMSANVPDMAIGCGLRTCQTANATCGQIGDGCGGILDCGSCTPPATCGGGGTPNQCGGMMGCVPRTCMSQNANCGPVGDGCGGLLDCGKCGANETCGNGGPSRCGPTNGSDAGQCVPATCMKLGFNCGPAGDGCGGLLDCGTCAMGQVCGAMNKPGVCGNPNNCMPKTCMQLGYDCGMAGDGCGGIINCGACMAPNICGGGGKPNVCGGAPDGGACVNLCTQIPKCDGGTTTITGTVLAPTNPQLGYGQPDPLYGAVVYIPNSPVTPFTDGVQCNQCGAALSGDPVLPPFTTDVDGKFALTGVPCGQNIPLVIQLGRWRRHIVIPQVNCCGVTALTPDQTRLPRVQHEGGDMLNNIPLIAVSTGSADPIECVLPKIGIDVSQFTLPAGAGRVRFYRDNGAQSIGGQNFPAASTLYNNPAELAKYDAVIFDCVGAQVDKQAAAQTNVINYTNAGGRVFASHYSYVWLYNDAPFSTTATWNVDQAQPPDQTVLIDMGFMKGMAFAKWALQVGASPGGLGTLPVQQVRHDFDAVNNMVAQRWLYTRPNGNPPNTPIEYTFNTPVGAMPNQQCGRVLFSDYHVNTGGNGTGSFPGECPVAPMTPQEKVLEFMIFDLTSCVQPNVPLCTPLTCQQQNANCGPVGDGCGNIIMCGTCPMGQICGNGGPNQCGPGCTPLTCQQQNINCGPAGDGCGGLLDCGTCPMGQVCGGGGAGKCGGADGGCHPLTCQQQGLMCGPAGDGCGGMINCGNCVAPQTCGGGGVPGQCGMNMCKPLTCMQQNATCGFVGDGCGGVINCGTCPMGQMCGGGGVANQCGQIG